MARVESLQFLSSVIDKLEPIGQMTPAQSLRAADWNALVQAVRDLARLVASREQTTDALLDERYAAVDHTHTGQVTLAWFDPRARSLLEESMSGAVEQRAALQSLRNEVTILKQDMASLRTLVEDIRIQVSGVRDEDASRQRDISRLSLRVETLAKVESDVANLGDRFHSIETDLQTALDFRNELVDEAGNPINVAGLAGRIGGLEAIRNNLRLANGDLVSMREIESSLARLEENTVNRTDVDSVILQRLRTGTILSDSGLIDTVAGQVESTFADRFEGLTATDNQLTGQVMVLDTGLTAQGGRLTTVESGLQSATTSLGALAGLPNQVAAQATRLIQAESLLHTVDARTVNLPTLHNQVATLEARTGAVDTLSADLGDLTGRVQTVESNMGQIDLLSGRLDTLSGRVNLVEERVTPLDSLQEQVMGHSATLAGLGQRVTTSEAELQNLEGVSDQVRSLARTTEEMVGWRTTVDRRIDDLSQQRPLDETIVMRLDTLEAVVAENNTVVRRVDQSVTSIEGVLPSLRALPDQLRTIDSRMVRLERGGTINR